jgi:hypothetical protein
MFHNSFPAASPLEEAEHRGTMKMNRGRLNTKSGAFPNPDECHRKHKNHRMIGGFVFLK